MAEIMMPKKQDGPMGRRLFAMAAPALGSAIGGPIGAVAGNVLGSKIGGASTGEALQSGLLNGALSRRSSALQQNPNVAVKNGLDVLSQLPQGDPLKSELAPGLIKADMLATNKIFGLNRGGY